MSPTERRVAAILAAHLAEEHPGTHWSARPAGANADGGKPTEAAGRVEPPVSLANAA